MPGLYEESVQGFAALPLPVRRLHGPGRARGTLDVVRGQGLLARMIAAAFGLPPAGTGVVVELVVTEQAGVQTWTRTIGDVALVSHQRAAGPARLLERLGLVECALDVCAGEDGTLAFVTTGASLLGVPIPPPLAPKVVARACGEGDAVRMVVEIGSALTGPILRYGGRVEPVLA
jgi:hypothetical protein